MMKQIGKSWIGRKIDVLDKGYVLVQGANRFTDTGAALLADPEVRRTFRGGS